MKYVIYIWNSQYLLIESLWFQVQPRRYQNLIVFQMLYLLYDFLQIYLYW